jgi:hypothetical protein
MSILTDIHCPNEAQILRDILQHSEKEIENGETVSIEEVMAEFGVEATQDRDISRIAAIPFEYRS